jgi:signal transduction histidine kinase
MLARLQDAFEKQSRFIADASHELRTPVSVLLSQTEHSLNRQRSPDEYRRALELCRETSRRMRSLIDGLLLLARADAGKPIRRREPVDLAEVVASCVEQLGPMAAQARVGIVTDLRASPVHGDPERLAQVVTNLVTNAIRYNNPNGQVRVESRPDAEEVALIVRDDGIGISLEHQPLLFDRFYRVDDARTQHDETGAGLGLSLVQEIVLAHGGRIQVRSAPGSGSEFSVHLPAAHEPGEPRPI